jgi:phage terminase large subunit
MDISRPDISIDSLQNYGRESFLRIPVANLLQEMKIEPIAPQIAFLNAVNNPKYKFITSTMSRRTGKTFIANVIGFSTLLVPSSSFLIVAPDYSLATISWDLQRSFISKFGLEVSRNNAKDRVIEMKNGSTVRIASVSKIDSAIGRSYDLIIFDEAAIEDAEESFNIQLLPTLDKPTSKAIFISTPRGKNWFYKFYNRGADDAFPEWASLKSTWKDNPRTPISVIESAQRAMSKEEFNQEFLCTFNSFEGTVWTLSEENIISSEDFAEPVQDYDEVIAGLDIGFKDPTAFVVIGIKDSKAYIIDEYLAKEKTTEKHAANLIPLIEKYGIDYIYIDSSAAQTKHDLAYLYDISTINAEKDVKNSIAFVGSLTDNNRLFVLDSCKHSMLALENYSWDKRATLVEEKPKHDQFSHMADAIRYALYTHRANLILEDIDGTA